MARLLRGSLLSVLLAAGCSTPGLDTPVSGDIDAAADSSVTSNSELPPPINQAPPQVPEVPLEPPVQHSPNCAAGMLEVDGKYCTALMHRCIRGGKTIDGEKTDYPDPYYCDEYKVGVAPCLGKLLDKHFCIDEYEYPNQKGAIPMVMVTWYEAKQRCEDQGKRLCGDDEWTLACEGPEHLPYAYGWKRDSSACNIDKLWRKPDDGALSSNNPERIAEEVDRLSQRVPSGAFPGCVSPYGVMDMGGNVDEWTVNITLHGKPYQSVFKGGHWCAGARNRCRPVTEIHNEITAYYAEGFRCCSNPLNVPKKTKSHR